MVKDASAIRSTASVPSKPRMRIFGPCRSARTATKRPSLVAAARMRSMRAPCSWWLPWEKFSRNTSTPAATSCSILSSLAGPSVATILVLRITATASCRLRGVG
jgi:hypothetical protein